MTLSERTTKIMYYTPCIGREERLGVGGSSGTSAIGHALRGEYTMGSIYIYISYLNYMACIASWFIDWGPGERM